jgi:3-hydroxy-9,10-secoandrosta-1,3,5(10)-triene-9,17-dione monooxygenase
VSTPPSASVAVEHTASRPGTYAELVARADALIPVLRTRQDETNGLRRLSSATRADLIAAGFARMFQPARYGGLEAQFMAVLDILPRVGRGCGSTAWCLAQYMGHAYMVAQWPPEAQDEVWGTQPGNLLAGILIPLLAKARAVPGGYRLTGRWPFVSGVNTCDWCILSGMVEQPGGADEERYFLVPQAGFVIHDTWFSVGLQGSGSNDISVDDVFVPEHMTLPLAALKGGPTPGNRVNTAPIYQMPSYMKFGILISSASLGMAQRMLDDYRDFVGGHTGLMSGKATRLDTTQHLKVAEASVCLTAAENLARLTCHQITAHVMAGTLPDDLDRTRYRAHGAYIGRQAWHAANLIWDAVMGRGVYESNPLARSYRDLATATRHFTHNWDLNGAAHGRILLGLPLDNPAL